MFGSVCGLAEHVHWARLDGTTTAWLVAAEMRGRQKVKRIEKKHEHGQGGVATDTVSGDDTIKGNLIEDHPRVDCAGT